MSSATGFAAEIYDDECICANTGTMLSGLTAIYGVAFKLR